MSSDSEANPNKIGILQDIEALIRAEGFVPLGFAKLDPMPLDMARFTTWLGQNRHASMAFLSQNLHLRADPGKLQPGTKTAILFGLPYAQGDKLPRKGDLPRIAQYARLADYHGVIWRKGETILSQIHQRFGDETAVGRVITDSAPILERALAIRGSRGFIGKNTCFISPKYGSMLLLGELLTSLDLPTSEPSPTNNAHRKRSEDGGCGSCRRCQVHCPTGALDEDYRIDARKCLAYWTIEHRGPIPEEFWPWLDRYIFGCDICQIVCPYNRGPHAKAPDALLRLRQTPSLFEIATMTQATYESFFAGTPVTRAKREGLIRNALIALTVTKNPALQMAMGILEERKEGGVIGITLEQIKSWLHRQT